MKKLTMLAGLLAKLEGPTKEAFIGELTDLIQSKAGGLHFKISENDITKTIDVGDDDQEQDKEAAHAAKFEAASKAYGVTGPDRYNGINVQEM